MTTDVTLLTIIAVCVGVMTVALVIFLRQVSESVARATQAVESLQREMAPVLRSALEATETANRAAALAEDALTRIDAVVRTTTDRVGDMVDVAHDVVTGPVKQGAALVAGLRAAWEMFAARQARKTRDDEDEDTEGGMFVG